MNKIFKTKITRLDAQAVGELATNVKASKLNKQEQRKENLDSFLSSFFTFFSGTFLYGSAASLAIASGLTDFQTVEGSAKIKFASPQLVQIQTADKSVLNWKELNVGSKQVLEFIQDNAHSSVLNRILGGNPSKILGQLKSNGQVFVINPAGIVFGEHARVDTAGFVASTLNLATEDFKRGALIFKNDQAKAAAAVVNHGLISVNGNGSAVLVGGSVANKGIIKAQNGNIFLLAGQTVEIQDLNNPNVTIRVTAKNEVVNLGQLLARGNITVAGNRVYNTAVPDIIRGKKQAPKVKIAADGSVVIFADGSGRVVNTASAHAKLDRSLNQRGIVYNNALVEAAKKSSKKDNLKILGDLVYLGEQSKLKTVGADVFVGGDPLGKGSVKLSEFTLIKSGSEIETSAHGDAGNVSVWGDELDIAGSITATSQVGKGGKVETSGSQVLFSEGFTPPNTLSAKGKRGEWLIDPDNLVIVDQAPTETYERSSTTSKTYELVESAPKFVRHRHDHDIPTRTDDPEEEGLSFDFYGSSNGEGCQYDVPGLDYGFCPSSRLDETFKHVAVNTTQDKVKETITLPTNKIVNGKIQELPESEMNIPGSVTTGKAQVIYDRNKVSRNRDSISERALITKGSKRYGGYYAFQNRDQKENGENEDARYIGDAFQNGFVRRTPGQAFRNPFLPVPELTIRLEISTNSGDMAPRTKDLPALFPQGRKQYVLDPSNVDGWNISKEDKAQVVKNFSVNDIQAFLQNSNTRSKFYNKHDLLQQKAGDWIVVESVTETTSVSKSSRNILDLFKGKNYLTSQTLNQALKQTDVTLEAKNSVTFASVNVEGSKGLKVLAGKQLTLENSKVNVRDFAANLTSTNANVSLLNSSINTSSNAGVEFTIKSGNFTIDSKSQINAAKLVLQHPNKDSLSATAVKVAGSVNAANFALLTSKAVDLSGSKLTGSTISVNGSTIKAENATVNATTTVSLDANGDVVIKQASVNTPNLALRTSQAVDLSGSKLTGSTVSVNGSTIKAENATVNATTTVSLDANGDVVIKQASVNTPNLALRTSQAVDLNGSKLTGSTVSATGATIKAENAVVNATTKASLDANGDVVIKQASVNAPTIELTSQAKVQVLGGQANASTVLVNGDSVELDSFKLNAKALTVKSKGLTSLVNLTNSGNLSVKSQHVELGNKLTTKNLEVNAVNTSLANVALNAAGNVSLNNSEKITLTNSTVFTDGYFNSTSSSLLANQSHVNATDVSLQTGEAEDSFVLNDSTFTARGTPTIALQGEEGTTAAEKTGNLSLVSGSGLNLNNVSLSSKATTRLQSQGALEVEGELHTSADNLELAATDVTLTNASLSVKELGGTVENLTATNSTLTSAESTNLTVQGNTQLTNSHLTSEGEVALTTKGLTLLDSEVEGSSTKIAVGVDGGKTIGSKISSKGEATSDPNENFANGDVHLTSEGSLLVSNTSVSATDDAVVTSKANLTVENSSSVKVLGELADVRAEGNLSVNESTISSSTQSGQTNLSGENVALQSSRVNGKNIDVSAENSVSAENCIFNSNDAPAESLSIRAKHIKLNSCTGYTHSAQLDADDRTVVNTRWVYLIDTQTSKALEGALAETRSLREEAAYTLASATKSNEPVATDVGRMISSGYIASSGQYYIPTLSELAENSISKNSRFVAKYPVRVDLQPNQPTNSVTCPSVKFSSFKGSRNKDEKKPK